MRMMRKEFKGHEINLFRNYVVKSLYKSLYREMN